MDVPVGSARREGESVCRLMLKGEPVMWIPEGSRRLQPCLMAGAHTKEPVTGAFDNVGQTPAVLRMIGIGGSSARICSTMPVLCAFEEQGGCTAAAGRAKA